MTLLIAIMEEMVSDYIKFKFNDEYELRALTPYRLETTLRDDEDANYDFKDRLFRIVMDELNWRSLVEKAQEDLPEEEDEGNRSDGSN